MSLIYLLPKIIHESKKAYEEIMKKDFSGSYTLREITGGKNDEHETPGNMLARGDNLSFMRFLMGEKNLPGKLKMIYIDPPFYTKAQYGAEFKLQSDKLSTIPAMKQKAYNDTWDEGMEEYLKMLGVRLMLMRDLLADDGSIFVHLDWHAVHYVKVLMDEIFGEKNFVNEIIWQYKSGGVSKRRFARKHDTILFYGKTEGYYFMPLQEKSYNRGYKPYRFKGVKEYRDELGWYTMVNRKDVWQIDMVGRTSAERTGYVTQKPESLIERILESCTEEGDICADFFGGSGTMAAAAESMGRRWITCDIGRLAAINSHKRLIDSGAAYSVYEESGSPGEDDKGSRGKGCGLDADAAINRDLLWDKMLLRVELKDYKRDSAADLPVEEKFLPVIEKIMKEDPLQFVAYWSIDYAYRDGINRPDVYLCRDAKGLEIVHEAMGSSFGPLLIKAVDIFGNSAELLLETHLDPDPHRQ
ncbi:hypothetical protein MASR2M70_04250 [Bacillota bacterium]